MHSIVNKFYIDRNEKIIHFQLSTLCFQFSLRHFSPSLIQGAPLGMLRPSLWCGGLAGAFRLFCGLLVRSGDGCLGGWLQVGRGYVPGVGVAIQMTLPPQPVRAAWWQPTLLIHVAWVRRVRNVKQGDDYVCDFCRPFRFTYTGCPSWSAPPALAV